ncbi:MAG: hypothetical protein QOH58_1174 [Thermoleophilaceae bacterium]|nr:hypothetical protein [Thermoleophilaceae bacterium]
MVLGFLLFAVDEIDKGSKTQQQAIERELGTPSAELIAPSSREEAVREEHNGAFREAVDDANDFLLAPFVDLIDSDNGWVSHGVPTLLALLLYGVGLGILANALPKQRTHGNDWRTAGP